MKKLLAIVIAITVFCGMLSVSFIGMAAKKNVELADIQRFDAKLSSMINQEKTMFSPNGSVADLSDGEQINRLIVKASGEIDDMGAINTAEGLLDLHIFQYATAAAAEEAYSYYKTNKAVDWVEYDRVVETEAVEPTVNEEWLTFDSSKHLSWGADYMGVDNFIEEISSRTLDNVIVAVVDSGIDTDHPLFKGFYDPASNPEGRILKNGENFSSSQNNIPFEDDDGHGTHVSGTIVDLTPSNVKILPVKVLDIQGGGFVSSVALGVLYAAYNGADIINMSLGGGVDGEGFIDEYVIDIAYDLGVLTVVAAGNETADTDGVTPAVVDKCITVSAVNKALSSSWYSNFGESVDVCAPGDNILSASMGGGYVYYNGTSMATPHVSAVAALYLSQNPSLSVAQLDNAIVSNAVDVGADGKDSYYGNGLVYAKAEGIDNLGLLNIGYSSRKSVDTTDDIYFEDPVEVSLDCAGAEEIYYTTDGTNPAVSATAKLYTEKFEVANTTQVRAIAYGANKNTALSIPVERKIIIYDTQPAYRLYDNGSELIGYTGILPESFTVPEIYTSIGDYAFADMGDMEAFYLPDSVTEIGEGSFMNNYFEVFDLNGVKDISALAFSFTYVSELKSDGIESIGTKAFYRADISEADLSDVKAVDDYAFSSATFSSEFDMPNLTEIGDYAFMFADGYEGVCSCPNAKNIGNYAFCFSNVLADAYMPEAVNVGAYAFYGAGISEVYMPKLKNAPEYAFAGNSDVSIRLPELTTVGECAFALSDAVISQETLNNIESVGYGAFYFAIMPQTTVMPKLTYAGEYAFVYSRGWVSASFPKLTYADEYAFACAYFSSIDVPVLETCGKYAFYYTDLIDVVDMPALKNVGDSAFELCYATKINLPAAETIGSRAFADSEVIAVVLSDKVTYIGENAFGYTAVICDESAYVRRYAEKHDVNFALKGTVFTVNFYNAYGRVVSTQEIVAGESAVPPASPFAFGQIFQDWDVNYECIVYDADIYPLYENIFTAIYNAIMMLIVNMLSGLIG